MSKQKKNQVSKINSLSISPIFYTFNNQSEIDLFASKNPNITIIDSLESQLIELIEIENPSIDFTLENRKNIITQYGKNHYIGTWVFYPWKNILIHLLSKQEFIKVRSNRNLYKITPEQQSNLEKKTIGIIGLSVGNAIAQVIAMERIAGTIKIADFDTLSLSNMNRINSNLTELGTPKAILCAQQIWEYDPFISIEIFNQGINEDNIDEFIEGTNPLDLLIEECDNILIKFLAREKCKNKKIPVIMETSENNILDIERYDLDSNYPIFHGKAPDIHSKDIKRMSSTEKLVTTLNIIGIEHLSKTMQASLLEIKSSINTWPQTASSVYAGAGHTGIAAKEILLKKPVKSGRYFLNIQNILNPKTEKIKLYKERKTPKKISLKEVRKSIQSIAKNLNTSEKISQKKITVMVQDACKAPSGGNMQPWEWVWKDKHLHLFHRLDQSVSILDYKNRGSYLAFGAALLNLECSAQQFQLATKVQLFPSHDKRHIATISFKTDKNIKFDKTILQAINNRVTDRNSKPQEVTNNDRIFIEHLKKKFHQEHLKFYALTEEDQLLEYGQYAGKGSLYRFLNDRAHYEMFNKELRWSDEEYQKLKTGIDFESIGATKADELIFKIASDPAVMHQVRSINGGKSFIKNDIDSNKNSIFIGIIAADNNDDLTWIEVGKMVQKIWLELTKAGYAAQPVSATNFLMGRFTHNLEKLNPLGIEIIELWKKIKKHLPGEDEPKFVLRVFKPDKIVKNSLRKDIRQTLRFLK